jgi:hypothetical protein
MSRGRPERQKPVSSSFKRCSASMGISDGWWTNSRQRVSWRLRPRPHQPPYRIGYSQEDIQRGIELKGQSRTEDALKDIESARAHWEAPGRLV